MKLDVTLCHSHLLSMLLLPDKFNNAVTHYSATTPDMNGEGFNGYMEVKATFFIKDLEAFNQLWKDSYIYPSDRTEWYHFIKNNYKVR